MLQQFLDFIVTFVHDFGYIGLFVMTFLESTFTPIPSEITLVPAGYLIHEGKMHALPVLLSCIAGTLCGSFFTYFIGAKLGVPFVQKFGKYFLFPESKLAFVQRYFQNHGSISIFTGRLIPGVRHVISFPAGIAQMRLPLFMIYTFLGSTLWILILLGPGYLIGNNKELLTSYVVYIKAGAVIAVALLVGIYYWNHRRKNKK